MPSHSHNKVQKQILTQYTLHNCILESVSSAKYLGFDISSDLSWDTHINRISKKTNNTLDCLRRNIKIHSESLKSSAYKVLVRPQLVHYSIVWCPFTDSQIQISLNLKLSNVELPDGSNMTMAMDRLPVSQKWCSPYTDVGSTNGE